VASSVAVFEAGIRVKSYIYDKIMIKNPEIFTQIST